MGASLEALLPDAFDFTDFILLAELEGVAGKGIPLPDIGVLAPDSDLGFLNRGVVLPELIDRTLVGVRELTGLSLCGFFAEGVLALGVVFLPR